ncbi:probable polygalacturonase isoform X1 [Phoenix dactylifera]|uniref:Probable polygalacturonase isoform X1 n=1 Tax=Phoenix dactylifera TaxID=42345 RepID=A0A8B7CA42_PHODC|nr:probable polygalacturonase isoform X1 [Phoenix dactylifera]
MAWQRHSSISLQTRIPPTSFQTLALWISLMAVSIGTADCARRSVQLPGSSRDGGVMRPFKYAATSCRAKTASLTDFGGVGDGKTSNTKAFQAAVAHLAQFAGGGGGGMLYVPAGRWLTGPFNLTNSFTLFLHRDAVILATQDMSEWPVIDPLPSYGRGRDHAGGRYSSLIGGSNLTDVIITGDNGTIDGQGAFWWQKFHGGKLKYTRGYLIELLHTDQIFISNLTLLNSPAWNIHPVYSSNIVISGITILAPVRSPNTDGINPDSCSHVRIEDCYIVSGDDCVAIKSGWDEYGIAVGMPSQHIIIRRLTCISPTSAVIALGSEMSGGIQDVRAEDITAIDSESGVRIKTAVGRGAYVKDIFVRGMNLNTMKWVFWMTGSYKSHPDNKYDPNAIPVVKGISYSDVVATDVTQAARLEGISNAPFTGICISNVTVQLAAKAKKQSWTCTDVEGVSKGVSPTPCASLPDQGAGAEPCPFPTDRLPIDDIVFEECSYTS